MAKYELKKWIVNRGHREDMARVHLHGERKRLFAGPEQYIEIVDIATVFMENDAEIVRCAVAASDHDWTVPFRINVSKFQGKFTIAIDARLKPTLKTASVVSTHTDAQL